MTADSAKAHHVFVAVLTTGGSYPADGFSEAPADQPIKVALHRAVIHLQIVNSTDWIATAGGKELNPELSYAASHLTGKIEINYGPREGGGGGFS